MWVDGILRVDYQELVDQPAVSHLPDPGSGGSIGGVTFLSHLVVHTVG